MSDEEIPPEVLNEIHRSHFWSHLGASAFSLLSIGFWGWMALDCYRRRGGLDTWHYFFFIFPPSVVLYFIVNKGDMVFGRRGGSSNGLFGFGLRSRITKAEQTLRVSGTLAARMELAELYFEAKRYPECEKNFDEVLKLDPKNLDAYYYVAVCRLERGDHAGALEYLQKVMDGNKKLRLGIAWLRYTDALIADNRRDEALEERRKLARHFPRPLTEFAYAQLLADTGQKDKAREMLDEMLATTAGSPAEDRTWVSKGKSLRGSL